MSRAKHMSRLCYVASGFESLAHRQSIWEQSSKVPILPPLPFSHGFRFGLGFLDQKILCRVESFIRRDRLLDCSLEIWLGRVHPLLSFPFSFV